MSFQVDQLALSFTLRLPGQGQRAWRVQLGGAAGNDGGILDKAGQPQAFRFPAAERVALLNALYKLHFFELPDRYAARMAATLTADGRVELSGADSSDATGNAVCVSIAAVEKCVRYGAVAPTDLDTLARRMLADAERLSRQP